MAEWRSSLRGFDASEAIEAGADINCEILYIGRANFQGELIPGKIVESHGCCYIPYDGEEISQSVFEYLTQPDFGYLSWVPGSYGYIPDGAVIGGRTSNGEPLYVGRALYEDCWIPGPVQASEQCLFATFDGIAESVVMYEVLVIDY